MVHEAAAAGVAFQRPADGVLHKTAVEGGVGHLPDLFEADAEFLRALAFGEVEFRLQLFGQRTTHAFGDEGVFGAQLQARLIVVLVMAVLGYAEHAGDHALHDAVLAIDDVRGGHAGIDFDAEAFGLLGQPAAHIGERGDIGAVVVHQRRHRPGRDVQTAGGA